MYLRGLVIGIIYQTGLHLAEAHRFLFLFPTVFTHVCFIENRATIPLLFYVVWRSQGFSLSEKSNAWAELDVYFPNFPTKNKSRLSSHSFKNICVDWNHANQWLETTGNFSKDWNLPFTGDFSCQLGKHGRDCSPLSKVFKWGCHICVCSATGGRSCYKPRSRRLGWWACEVCVQLGQFLSDFNQILC